MSTRPKDQLAGSFIVRLAPALQGKKNWRVTVKKVPSHRSENEEREFWSKADSTDYIDDWKGAKRVTFSKLKPSLRTISLRLPEMMIEELKFLANKMDVPYQTVIKIYLSERIRKELESANV